MIGARRCCCKATLRKFDPSNGTVAWRVNRGALSVRLDLYDDGSDLWVYEVGTNSTKHGAMSKWLAGGANQWDYDPSGDEISYVRRSSDGAVWGMGSTGTFRVDDSDGSELSTSASPSALGSGGGDRIEFYDSSSRDSGDMILTASTSITLYDSSISSVTGVSTNNSRGFPLGDDPTGSLTGLVYTELFTQDAVTVGVTGRFKPSHRWALQTRPLNRMVYSPLCLVS